MHSVYNIIERINLLKKDRQVNFKQNETPQYILVPKRKKC
jgi:hypothetical protein